MGKYIDYHQKFLKEGPRHPQHKNPTGLCCAMDYDSDLEDLFAPEHDEYDYNKGAWWAGGTGGSSDKGVYTPMRQNIVLFLAAMNGEL